MRVTDACAALRALGDDWDSYGGKAPDERAIKAVEEGLSIVPMSDGGIQVELHIRDRDVEIVVTSHGYLDSVLSCEPATGPRSQKE